MAVACTVIASATATMPKGDEVRPLPMLCGTVHKREDAFGATTGGCVGTEPTDLSMVVGSAEMSAEKEMPAEKLLFRSGCGPKA